MEIILLEDVINLGNKNDIVSVKPGYGRNFLLPKKFAVLATESAKKVLAENIKQRAHKEEKIKQEAIAFAAKMEGLTLTIGTKASATGKIFGSVNTIQLAEAITKAGFAVERKQIILKEDHVKELGNYSATVKLHRDVKVEVAFTVVAE